MDWARHVGRRWFGVALAGVVLATLVACQGREQTMAAPDRIDFARRYAAAWSGQDPVKFAAFYEANGALVVNGSASIGRAAIEATARAYMTAFPDMRVQLDSLREEQGTVVFHWTWTGTNTGPGGTGRAVRLSGDERWTFGVDGRLAKSDGHFDAAEYQRQLKGEATAPR